MTGLELFLAAHLLLTPVSADSSPACPAQKSARVDVRWRSEPVKYDNNQGSDSLGSKSIDSANPYGTHVATDVGGLMSGKIAYKSAIQISSLRFPTMRQTCLWIDKVMVDIVIDPTIQIAAEHPKGTCEYVAILEHESKHVAIDRSVVEDHLNGIRLSASNAVQKVGVVGPKADDSINGFRAKMSAYIEGALKESVDVMYVDRTKRQQGLDTKAEYDRVQAKCPK